MKELSNDTPGGRLRAARLARKVTQADLGAALGVDRAHVSKVETTSKGGRDFWERAARELGVSLDWLLMDDASGQQVSEPGQAPMSGQPMPDTSHDDEDFAETAAAVEAMLIEEHMPADTRTVSRLTRIVWRDMEVYRRLTFEDRLALALSEHRSKLKQARAAIFQKAR
jgi:transcriptional regulator with XRE-family HTH domain